MQPLTNSPHQIQIATSSAKSRSFGNYDNPEHSARLSPFSPPPTELRRMIWHYAFFNTYAYRRMHKVNTRRLRFHLRSLHIPYENPPHTLKPVSCRKAGMGLCHAGEDGPERGVYFVRRDMLPTGKMPVTITSCVLTSFLLSTSS